MHRLKTQIYVALGLSAQLMTLWLALAPGLVLCMEEDGGFAVEASIVGGVCGDGSTGTSKTNDVGLSVSAEDVDHCEGCLDVPLYAAGASAAEHPHATVVSPTMTVSIPTLSGFSIIEFDASTKRLIRALRVVEPSLLDSRTTVLRI
jgi:hypothetical protein